MELTGYLAVARRWWWTLLVATWVAALAGLLVASRITPTYEAQVQLLVGPINTDSDTLKASGLLVQTYAQLAISPPLLKSTAQETGVADPVKLGQNVRATANDVTRVLAIRVQDSDPARASQIANTMADELIQLTTGATTRPEGQLEVIGAAVPPLTPIAPQVSLIVLLAMVAGLLGGLILVIVVEYATDTVRDREDLGRLAGVDVLATLAFDARTPGIDPLPMAEATAPSSPHAIALRLLASKVAFAEADRPTRTIMVVGIGEGDSALVAAGIAAAVSASGHRAVLVDASPDGDLTTSFGLAEVAGLREAISRDGVDGRPPLAAGPAGIRVLPRGRTGSVELVAVDRARSLLEGLLREADLVVIDGGAMQRSAGALSWARAAQQTIVLVRRGSSRREDLRLAIDSLRFVSATIGGAVLVQRSPGRSFGRSRRSSARRSEVRPNRPTAPPAGPASAPTWAAAGPSSGRLAEPEPRGLASRLDLGPVDVANRQDGVPSAAPELASPGAAAAGPGAEVGSVVDEEAGRPMITPTSVRSVSSSRSRPRTATSDAGPEADGQPASPDSARAASGPGSPSVRTSRTAQAATEDAPQDVVRAAPPASRKASPRARRAD